MKYDFTTIMDREGKDAIAVDVANMGNAFGPRDEAFDFIPMWIADMNFGTVPTVQEAIGERLAHPAYGYFMTREDLQKKQSVMRMVYLVVWYRLLMHLQIRATVFWCIVRRISDLQEVSQVPDIK